MKKKIISVFSTAVLIMVMTMVLPTPQVKAILTYTPIYDIQYTANPSGDSPLIGQTNITTEGIVTALFFGGYFIEDPSGGPWSGLYVYDSNTPALGDRLRLTGTVDEYYNLTELKDLTFFQVLSSGNLIPNPEVLATGDVSQEQWEGVLVRVEYITVTDGDLGFGEWSVNDSSGNVMVDDRGSYTYVPTTGDVLYAIIGPLDYSYGAFKIQPRDDNDIIVPVPLVINEILADPATDLTGDANGDGVSNYGQDEFIEIVNDSDYDMDFSNWTLSDGYGERHVFPPGTIVPSKCAIIVFGGGTPTGLFGNVIVQVASTGALGLNNSGDTVTLNDGLTDQIIASYGSEGGNNQSLTLDPDITGGVFVLHSTAIGSGGALFSPGTMINGSSFVGCSSPNVPPVADANGPYTADPGATITLDGTGSYDPDGQIISYEWDLDNDGEFDDGFGSQLAFTVGNTPDVVYYICLQVVDDSGLDDIDCTQITVNSDIPQPPVEVGGIIQPTHKLILLLYWVIPGVIFTALGIFIKRRHRVQSRNY